MAPFVWLNKISIITTIVIIIISSSSSSIQISLSWIYSDFPCHIGPVYTILCIIYESGYKRLKCA